MAGTSGRLMLEFFFDDGEEALHRALLRNLQADMNRQEAQARAKVPRRGGYNNLKPRQGLLYCRVGSGLTPVTQKKEEWEHDPSCSTWNKVFPEETLGNSYHLGIPH